MLMDRLCLSHFGRTELCVTFHLSFGVCPQRAFALSGCLWAESLKMGTCFAFHQHVSVLIRGHHSRAKVDPLEQSIASLRLWLQSETDRLGLLLYTANIVDS